MSPVARRLAGALVPALAVGWLWFARPTPLVAVLAATVALAGAAHGWGRMIGRWLDDGDAPPSLAIGWGVAAYLVVGRGLAAAGLLGAFARDVIVVAGLLLGLAWAAGARAASAPAPRPRVATMTALGLGLLAILGAAGALAASTTDPVVLAAVTGDVGRAGATTLGPALGEQGWAFALVLALTATIRGPALARVLVVLAVAALPDGPVEVRWTAAACALAAALTVTAARRPRRAWIVVVGLAIAAASTAEAGPAAAAVGAAVGAAAWALARSLDDDDGARAALVGRVTPRALVVITAAVLMVLAVAGARARAGRPPRSWQDRIDRRIDDTVMLFHARRAPMSAR